MSLDNQLMEAEVAPNIYSELAFQFIYEHKAPPSQEVYNAIANICANQAMRTIDWEWVNQRLEYAIRADNSDGNNPEHQGEQQDKGN